MAADGPGDNILNKEQFEKKTVDEVSAYLKDNDIDDHVCEKFEDEEIDGQAFLELDDDELKTLGKKIGVVKKLNRLKESILSSMEPQAPSTEQPSLVTPTRKRPPMFSLSRSSSPLFSPPGAGSSGNELTPFSPESSDDNISMSSASSMLKKPSASNFTIPDTWRPSIMQCLKKDTDEERRLELDPSRRNEIVRDLVSQMFAVEPKPTSSFATVVAKKLVRKYPFMKDVGDKVSGYGSWEKRIIERLNNVRGQAMRKRPRSDDDAATSTPAKRGRPKVSTLLSRYPALHFDETDAESLSRSQTKLNQEALKPTPNKAAVLLLQRPTYGSRRDFILSGVDSIAAILAEHPVLHLPFSLELEMDLVVEQKDTVKRASEKWTKLFPGVITYSETFTGKSGTTLKEIRDEYEDDEEELSAFAVLIHLLGKKDALIYAFEKCKVTDDPNKLVKLRAKMTSPRFAAFGESSYYLFVEGIVLCQVTTFTKALCLWFAIHYIFHLEYCKPLKEVGLFFQEFVFGLPQKTKKTATYLTTSSDIFKYVT